MISLVLEDIELDLLNYVNYDFATKFNVLPIRRYDNGVIIICSEIMDKVINDLKVMFNDNVVPYIRSIESVQQNIAHYYEVFKSRQNLSDENLDDIYDDTIRTAIDMKVSDIHIEPNKSGSNVRFRRNGELEMFKKLSFRAHKFISTKIKVMSNLDITEKRISQDGKITYKYNDFKYNLRVSTLLTSKGEKISIRIHNNRNEYENIIDLGFSEEQIEIIEKYLMKKNGMIILSGPTGSGKSTTLYKFIEHINTEKVSIYTIEDPVEYEIDGINQSSINEKAGLTFDEISKNILRHDPDVLMIGEIRDEETAKVAVSSSVVGHKVFSTIHAKDSLSVVTRLIDLGVSEFLAIDALDLVISQRLVKKLCRCKKKKYIDEMIVFNKKYEKAKYYSPNGCEKCKFTGYSGRILLSEILVIDDIIKDMLLKKKIMADIRKYIEMKYFEYSFSQNVQTLIESGEVYIKDMEILK
ncbi:GspE/PulE family protein [Candidatus Arthromitus sp. SFB-rat-Yit]|uniref:GspE/PulE family protein n=1 Tax=Candidatus Arthromitus sp. SFB-rat-Yit TaxID=1041504 RepID=UPI000227A212|nr:GspE/PulE family protein [Candidatus Arthromitus sp. SFB-rat-Yit]BAK81402.1 type II secretion system protein E [Candidatus Arthromitus sp. SFB-rat-Yit]